MRKLTDSELATRTRETNRRRSERQRQRKTIAGRAALTVWVPVGLRSRFVTEAAGQGITINELATRFIEAGMRESKTTMVADMPDPVTVISNDSDTADLFAIPEPVSTDTEKNIPPSNSLSVSVGSDRTAMMLLVDSMMHNGLSGADIARRLNADGYRSSNGKELVGPNVLREYRKWKAN